MSNMLRSVALLLGLTACAAAAYAFEHKVDFPITASADATDSDKSSADSSAFNQAKDNATGQCQGDPGNVGKTFDMCLPTKDADGNQQWSCTVNVTLHCWLTTR
jgi:hypothetical protein